MIKKILYIIIAVLNISFSYTEISFGQGVFNNSTNLVSFPLNYTTDSAIYGFQFTVDYDSETLLLNQLSGGVIENSNIDFSVWLSQNTGNIISFSEDQNYIQPGSGVLANLSFEIINFNPITSICITNPIFAGTPGETLNINDQICIEYELTPATVSLSSYNYQTNSIDFYITTPAMISSIQFELSSGHLMLENILNNDSSNFNTEVNDNLAIITSSGGSYINPGENILIATLAFNISSFDTTSICVDNIFIESEAGQGLSTNIPDCISFNPPPVQIHLSEDFINNNIQVTFNSAYDIAGFQFETESQSAILISASGGESANSSLTTVTNFIPEDQLGIVISYSTNNAFIEAGEFIATELYFEGIQNDIICLKEIDISNRNGLIIPIGQDVICQEYNFIDIAPYIEIIDPQNQETIIGYDIPLTILSENLSPDDTFNIYLNSQEYGTYSSNTFSINPAPHLHTGLLNLKINVADNEGQEYQGLSSTDSVQINFAIPGDYNLDGNINVGDIVLIVQYILDAVVPNELQAAASDFNSSGEVNISDIVLIVQYILD